MADHYHACNRCSTRWNCDARQCRNKPRGICFWCKAEQAAVAGQPQIPHDHEWAGGEDCSICERYNDTRKRNPRSGVSLITIIIIICALIAIARNL